MRSNRGFTLIELLIYVSILATVGVLLTGILTNSIQITTRGNASTEVVQQLNLVMGTIQKLVSESSLIESAYRTDDDINPSDDPSFGQIGESNRCDDAQTYCTLKLRFEADSDDPTWIIASSTGIYLVRDDDTPVTTTLLSRADNKMVVDYLRFTKYVLAGGHDSAEINLSLTYDTDNDKYSITRALSSAVTRVTAVTFDDDILPSGTRNVGSSGSKWQDGFFSRNVTIDGTLDVAGHSALGSSASTDNYRTLNVVENYTGIGSVSSYSAYLSQTRTQATALTATTYARGIYNTLLYNMTEDLVTPYHGYGYAAENVVYTNGTYTYYQLRGASNTAYSQSTASSNQDILAGSLDTAYINSTGTVTNAYGSYSQAYTLSTGTMTAAYGSYGLAFTNAAGSNIGTAVGAYGSAYESTGGTVATAVGGYFSAKDATTNYGVRGFANPDDAETFANAYAAYFDAYSNGASTIITNAYGVVGRAREVSWDVTNAYAGYFTAPSAAGTNYGVYSSVAGAAPNNYGFYGNISGGTTDWGIYITGEDKNYFSGNVGIGQSSPTYKLEVVGTLKATDYYSDDGTQGMTGTCTSGMNLTVKDGLITACAAP